VCLRPPEQRKIAAFPGSLRSGRLTSPYPFGALCAAVESPGQVRQVECLQMKRSGVADLPLHGGRVPAWLAERTTKMGTAIAESVVYHYGVPELLTRLSHPHWFQALGVPPPVAGGGHGQLAAKCGPASEGSPPRTACGLCRELCRNPAIPTRIGPCRKVSLYIS